jgi:predicted ATPase
MEKLPELAQTQPELLAHHYTQAGLLAAALDRWQAAAERAVHRSAYVEAIHSIDQALAQLAQLPPDEARDRRELELQAMKLGPLQPVKGYSSPEIDVASGRALTLCRSLGDRGKLFPVLYSRWGLQYVAGRFREAFVLSGEYLDAARASGDDAGLIVGQRIHAAGLFMRGDPEGARGLAREAVQLYVPERHRPLIARFGQDLRAQSLIYVALSEALLGRIDEARALGDEAIEHARSVDHLNTLGYTLFHCGVWLQAILRETDALRRHGAELLELAREHRFGFWWALATPFLLEGEEAERAVRAYRHEFSAGLMVPQQLCHVADSYAASGLPREATRVLGEAQGLMEQHGDAYWEPELFRLKGRLALAEGQAASIEAVTAFERALRLSRERGAHLLELRAATDLARLHVAKGQPLEARKVLAPVYASFTAGFDAKDLKEAKAVLVELETNG